MARLDYVEYEDAGEELRAAYDQIRSSRPNVGNIYKLMGHSPELTTTILQLVRFLNQKTALDRRLRELVIMTVARTTGSRYLWTHHAGGTRAAGVSREELKTLGSDRDDVFDARTGAALRYADEVARSGEVKDATFAELRSHFSPNEIAEMTILAGAYVMFGRWLSAVQADLEPEFQDEWWE